METPASPTACAGKKFSAWWLVAILLLGFGLRWMQLSWAQGYCFNMQGDGIEAYSVAVNYANGDAKAQYIGQPNYNNHSKLPGPLWTLFCVAGLRLTGTAEGIMWEMLALNMATIYLAYLLAKWTLGQRIALWTAFMLATFPRVVTFSIPVYNPNVMPFLGTLMFIALWRVCKKDCSRAMFWVPFIPLLALQFHMSGLILIPTAIAVIIITAARVNYLWLGGGLLAGASLYLPYLRGEMANHWQNTAGMFGGGSGGFSVEALKVISSTIGFFVSWSPGWIRADHEYVEFGRACFGGIPVLIAIYLVSTILAGYLMAGIVLAVRKAWQGFSWKTRKEFTKTSGIIFLSVVLVVPLLCALTGGKAFHARYCLVFEAPLFALGAAALVGWQSRPGKNFFRGVATVAFATNLWILTATNVYQKHNIQDGGTFIPSFRKLETVYQQLKLAAGEQPVAVDDTAYFQSLPPKDVFRRNALLIRPYIAIREREVVRSTGKPEAPLVFTLQAAGEVQPTNSITGFDGNGIALVAHQEPAQR